WAPGPVRLAPVAHPHVIPGVAAAAATLVGAGVAVPLSRARLVHAGAVAATQDGYALLGGQSAAHAVLLPLGELELLLQALAAHVACSADGPCLPVRGAAGRDVFRRV